MTKISKLSFRILLSAAIIFTSLASAVGVGYAQEGGEGMTITGTADVQCGEVQFTFNWSGGPAPYLFRLDFGDGNSTGIVEVSDSTYTTSHIYFNQGNYALDVEVAEKAEGGLSGIYSEILPIIIPDVTLSSVPFPPLFVVGDPGLVDFSTLVTGGTPPYTYAWDLVGDGSFDTVTGDIASSTYSEVGKYKPLVLVTDANNCTATDTMLVVVADPEDACQPTAQKIADGVNTLFPDQSGDLYTCDEIYGIFDNEGEENNLGFGQMWKAYNLALTMEELTWEDILDWKLNESGWGTLLQLDRFAELLEEHSLPDLMLLVMSEEYSLGDVRTAVRSVTRYKANFEDALARIADGASTGELTQFYKLAGDLDTDPAVLDGYLADGLSLSELKHAGNIAEKMEVDWTEIADARTEVDSWGDINQAYHLATGEISAAEILNMGVQEYKETQRIKTKTEQQEQKSTQQEEKQQQTTAEGLSEKDYQNALQISSKYGSTQEEVLAYHQDFCGEDWTCTRSYFRNMHTETKETGKPNK